MDTRGEPHRQLKAQSRVNYLVIYNAISCMLWCIVLARLILLLPLVGPENVYGGLGTWTLWTQSLAVLEIVHSLTGLVRAPLFTTGMQVASRLLVVWLVLILHPHRTQQSFFYSSMLVAWSVTEIIRYSYFVVNLHSGAGNTPAWLQWLRYNTFFVLYPLGITSECVLVLKVVLDDKEHTTTFWKLFFLGALCAYVPGAYILYTHMIKQRRKVKSAGNGGKTRRN